MAIISEPMTIGARDLLKGVDYTYCEGIDVLSNKFRRKKWKPRYVILSQGCLYIYTDRNAKKAEFSSSLKHFESAGECNPECGENICFCLRYKSAQAPIVFSCDTLERREKWVDCFCAAISEVQSHTVSADSAFGSAETIPRKLRTPLSNDECPEYDEVNEWLFREYKETASSAKKDDDDDYLLPNNLSRSNSKRNGVVYENFAECRRGTFQSDATQKVQKRGIHPGTLVEELKLKIDRTCTSAGSVSSASCDAFFYLSVRDGGDCASTEDSLSYMSVRGEESLYANENDAGNSSDSGNTSPVTTYETPEIPDSLKPHKFKRKDYICHGKGKATRELKQKPVGVFAVFPGESAELGLCVVTPHGLKYFRIHSHNKKVSLFETHQSDTFSSLDDLLTFYHNNALPRKVYSVKLQKGYNTMS